MSDNQSNRRGWQVRWWMILFVILAAICLFVIFVLPALINVNTYRGKIQAQLERRLGRQVTLGNMRLTVVPLAFQVENASIAEDPAFQTGRPFATAEQLQVSAQLWPLLHGDVKINALRLTRPDVELVKNAQGVWNFASLGNAPGTQTAAKQPAPGPQPGAASPPPQPKAQGFTLAEVAIRDGQLAITDRQKRQPRAVYDHIDLTAEDFAPGKAFPLSLAAHFPGAGNQLVKLEGTIGPVNMSDPAASPFDGKLQMDEASVAAVQKFLNSPALQGTDAVVTGQAQVKSRDGQLSSQGTLDLQEVRIRNVQLGYPIALDYVLADNLDTGLLQIGQANLKLGATPISIAGTANLQPTPAQLDLRVNAGDIGIQEVARLAAAFGVAFNPGATIDGRINADLSAKGASNSPLLNGHINAVNLVISGKQLAQPVNVPQVQLALTPQSIQSNDFTAATGGTTVGVKFALARYASSNPEIEATVRTVNGKVNELLDIAKAYGVSAVEGMQGSGSINLDVTVSGPAKNMNAMTFAGTGALRNASLQVPGITKPLAIRTTDVRFANNGATLSNFSGALGSSNATGQMTLSNFSAPVVQFNLSADKLVVAEWQQMIALQPAAPRTTAEGILPVAYAASPAPAAQPSLFSKVTGGGTITAGSVIYDNLTLTNAQAKVTLDHGIVRLAPITAQVYGGVQSGSIVMDTRTTPTTYTVNTKLERVDANQLLSSVSSVKQVLYGLLAGNAKGSFAAVPGGDIARTLNGSVDLDLVNGRLTNLDLLYQLASIGKFLSYAKPMQPYTDVAKLTGTFDIANGVATTNNLKAVLGVGSMAGDGSVNLADDSLNMRLTAVLSKQFSGQVGGAGIGGMLQTALANNNGELVIPVIVRGTFQHPQVTPDAQKLAQMRMENLLPTAGNPGALTTGILGAILNKQGGQAGGLGGVIGAIAGQQQPAGQQGQQQQPGIGGIVGAITGQRQQPQQQAPTPQPGQPQAQPPAQPPPQQQPPGNVFTNILNQVLGGTQQQQQKKQPQPPPPPPPNQPPPPQPR